jgi:hypothetical protein
MMMHTVYTDIIVLLFVKFIIHIIVYKKEELLVYLVQNIESICVLEYVDHSVI